MSVPNPFDPYRLQGCYGPPDSVLPDRPEWAPGKVWDGSKWTRAEEGQQ